MILPSPPVNQLIPASIGPVTFLIKSISLPSIPDVNCSTAHTPTLIIFPSIPLSKFSMNPNISPNIVSNKQNKISRIFLNAFCAAGPKKKSSGFNFLPSAAKTLKSDIILFINPVRILFNADLIILCICWAVDLICCSISTIAFVRGLIKFPWNDSRTEVNATKSVSACPISPTTLSSHKGGFFCVLVYFCVNPAHAPLLSHLAITFDVFVILLFLTSPDLTSFSFVIVGFSTATNPLFVAGTTLPV